MSLKTQFKIILEQIYMHLGQNPGITLDPSHSIHSITGFSLQLSPWQQWAHSLLEERPRKLEITQLRVSHEKAECSSLFIVFS